jgi:hypothetical protein
LAENYLGKILGEYKFQDTESLESSEQDDSSYAWLTDTHCDQDELFWNTKDQRKFKIIPVW